VIFVGLALTPSDCCPVALKLTLPAEYPFFMAVAVIAPELVELTYNMTWPFGLVTPLALAIPVSVTVDSPTALLPLVTVKVTYAGTPAVTDVGFDATDNACAPVEVIAIDPPA
jgi:hypothetical protein